MNTKIEKLTRELLESFGPREECVDVATAKKLIALDRDARERYLRSYDAETCIESACHGDSYALDTLAAGAALDVALDAVDGAIHASDSEEARMCLLRAKNAARNALSAAKCYGVSDVSAAARAASDVTYYAAYIVRATYC